MKLLAWNCRGLGNCRAVQELVDIVQAQDPMIVFLSKTWSSREHMLWVRDRIHFDGCFTVPTDGRGGGLALLWKQGVAVWVDSFSGYHIDSIIVGNSECSWQLTGFYGEPEASRRSDGWNMLRMLNSKPKLPWCCFGDFNELLEVQDKKGGVPRDHNLMENFREVLDACGFADLGYSGEERHKWHRKPFRFEAMWVTDSGCRDTISQAWSCSPGGTAMYATTVKLKQCKQRLKAWSRDHFGHVQSSIKRTKEWLWRAEEDSVRSGICDEVDRLKKELNDLCDKEEKMWHQRSRIQWLKDGDQNTRFFHGCATQRKRQNFIKGMRDDQGVMQEDEGVVSAVLIEYYSKLFTSSNPHVLDRILDGVQPMVTDEMKVELDKPYTSEESAFIADRLITDNILIAFESLHHMKTNCTGNKGFMAMKLDMSKAYDRVEWVFLEQILLKLGFQEAWVDLIMECITTVSYSILVNGEPKGMITPSRGLRQGDPLSPYLFLFCAEGLNALLCDAVVRGDIHGFSICRNGPKLTYLFFADDCLIFCRSTLEECHKIQELLGYYEVALGQIINKEKTTLLFSKNTEESFQVAIQATLQVPAIRHFDK
ncbi:uncharacterized protein LOC136071035 [Quercus suber]|uniref:uncharacterized protein LOC136071035 n=1 Tax=Quercus suber TaxID=58331 RepID=UPI0032DEC933